MRRLLAALFLLTTFGCAADFTGEWSGTGTAQNHTRTFYFVFWQEGLTLNGSGGPDLSDQDVIENGRIDGGRISFDLFPIGKTSYHFDFSEDGTALKGTFQYKEGRQTISGTASLKKVSV